MRNDASVTAETMALQRSFESHEPARRRLFADPYAEAFLRPSFRALAAASGLPGIRRLAAAAYDSIGGPGPRPSAIVRTKVIDDAVSTAAAGADQCVLLGAGYDTRAHRLPELTGCRVFEVDHPATQGAKRAVLERLGTAVADVTYVAVDFERDDLESGLEGAGFERTHPAVFVWEGVTQYLTPEAVASTLEVLRGLAAPGSVLVVTYVDARALGGASQFTEAPRWLRAVARVGEPWIFGLLPEDAAGYFADHGFVVERDLSMLEASAQLLRDRPRRHWGSALYRVVIARSAQPAPR